MAEPGFVYALLNLSMEGMIKVGRTARDPSGRVAELSRATGVPTTFHLAFKRYFSDCEAAESFVHALLEQEGYRVATNREFFRAPLEEVIDAIIKAPGLSDASLPSPETGQVPPTHAPDPFFDDLTITDPPVWQAVFDEAEAYYYGHGDSLQDYAEALKLYKQSVKLGAVAAYLSLGTMYVNGEGCSPSKAVALDYFKEGARKGDTRCYAEMAELFSNHGQPDNARKCWLRFFDEPLTEDAVLYCYQYLWKCITEKVPIEHVEQLRPLRTSINRQAQRMVALSRGGDQASLLSHDEHVASEIARILAG